MYVAYFNLECIQISILKKIITHKNLILCAKIIFLIKKFQEKDMYATEISRMHYLWRKRERENYHQYNKTQCTTLQR